MAFRTFSTVIRLIVIQFFSSPKKHICFTCLVYLLIDSHSPSNEPAKSQKEALWGSIVLRVKDLSLISGLSPLGLYCSSRERPFFDYWVEPFGALLFFAWKTFLWLLGWALWGSIVLRVKDLSLITGLSPLGLYYSSGKILSLITGPTTKSMWGHSITFRHFDEANARNVGNRYSHDLSSSSTFTCNPGFYRCLHNNTVFSRQLAAAQAFCC